MTPHDIERLLPFIVYLHATLARTHWRRFAEALRRQAPAGGAAMDYAEQLVQQGRAKLVEDLLRAGVSWDTIKTATGIDPDALRAMQQAAGPEAAPEDAEPGH